MSIAAPPPVFGSLAAAAGKLHSSPTVARLAR
jgi:hypothetical protein